MDAVVFDLDGVLLRKGNLRSAIDEPVEETATEKALADLGITDPPEAFLDAVWEGSYPKLAEATETFGIDADPKEIWPLRERYLAELEQYHIQNRTRKACEDVDVIDRLIQRSIHLGIASNARHETVLCTIEYLAFDPANTDARGQYLEPDDWFRRKPEPDYILDVMERIGTQKTGVYVGDSESDVIAAKRAGLESAFIRRDHNRHFELDHTPTYELDTLYDLLDIL